MSKSVLFSFRQIAHTDILLHIIRKPKRPSTIANVLSMLNAAIGILMFISGADTMGFVRRNNEHDEKGIIAFVCL